jgi:molybdopterin converting factor small subunit
VRVTVRSIGPLRQVLGEAELDLAVPEGTTVGGLLDQLAEEKGPEFSRLIAGPKGAGAYAPLRVVVHGRDLLPHQYGEAVLRDADDVLMFTPIAGG